jgi:hypothetical protein
MRKARVSRTYGPIHFEDLDPHRFEDLIRELIYDYKNWQSIEATGRSGSDDGFDIRAYERVITPSSDDIEDDEFEEAKPMEGNLWMIQVKREKNISPRKIKKIIAEVNSENPPYGYILAASSNFSKRSYDIFRDEIRSKGVMEFYLWGNAELEDMLHLPKNDRILFTFFGISLVTKRKSRVAEVRSIIIVKNKLYRAIGDGYNIYQSVLLRDLKDVYYPYKNEYSDFKKRPRWKEYIVFSHHPIGIWCHVHKYFAYIDIKKKEWDFTGEVDMLPRMVKNETEMQAENEKQRLVEGTWEFFPKANQGYLTVDSLIKYADITLVDDKGDNLYRFPHLYVDFSKKMGPFSGFIETLVIGDNKFDLTDDYKRIKAFPDTLQEPRVAKIYQDKKIDLDEKTLEDIKKCRHMNVLFDLKGKYSFLKPRDIIPIANSGEGSEEVFIQITYMIKTEITDYLDQSLNKYGISRVIEQQLGHKFDECKKINVYEFKRIYRWQFDNNSVIK